MLLLKNANILTMSGKNYTNGDILINEKIIQDVGENLEISQDTKIIDCTGKTILPGFIDAHCHIGISEDGTMYEGEDKDEAVNPITPHLRAIDAINPRDLAITEAYEGGVTTVCVGPGSANVFGGIMTIFKTYGNRIDDMVINDTFAIKGALGEGPKTTYAARKETPTTRMGIAGIMRKELFGTKNYMEKRDTLKTSADGRPELNLKYEALSKLLRKEIPLVLHANRMDDIYTALRIAKEFDIKLIITQASDAYKMTDAIKAAGVPLILGANLTGRMSVECAGMSHKAPVFLKKAGIEFCMSTDAPPVPIQFLPTSAGCAVREGLDVEATLKSITITPAKILGIADRVGSIEKGKDADIVVYNGRPFNLMSSITMVLINGNIVYKKI